MPDASKPRVPVALAATDAPAAEDLRTIDAGLDAYNAAAAPLHDVAPLAVPRLHTARCVLRPAARADLAELEAAVRAPGFPAELPLAQLAASGKLAEWLDRMCARMADGRAHVWSIDLAEGARCIGQVSLVERLATPAWALAFWLHPAHWGHGLAREAVGSAVDAAFATLGIDSIWAGVADWNRRSAALLEHIGFRSASGARAGDAPGGDHEPVREFVLERR